MIISSLLITIIEYYKNQMLHFKASLQIPGLKHKSNIFLIIMIINGIINFPWYNVAYSYYDIYLFEYL